MARGGNQGTNSNHGKQLRGRRMIEKDPEENLGICRCSGLMGFGLVDRGQGGLRIIRGLGHMF